MKKKKVIANQTLLNFYFRVLGNDKSIRAGEYLFKKNISFYEVIKTLGKRNLVYRKITIPECLTVFEIVEILKI